MNRSNAHAVSAQGVESSAPVGLDRELFRSADLAAVIEGHNEHTVDGKDPTRRFDRTTPYAVHPIWCGATILTEPLLPLEVRRVGSQALFYHDFLEDIAAPIPDWVPTPVRNLVEELTFHNGSQEKMEKVWFRTPIAQLCVLYDVVSNFLDGSWMSAEKRDKSAQFLRDLSASVEREFGALNIVAIARALTSNDAKPKTESHEGQGWEMLSYLPEVRVSIAHLVLAISEPDGPPRSFGILNRKALEKGQRIYGALGGAAEFLDRSQEVVAQQFGGREFEGKDARFVTSGANAFRFCELVRARGLEVLEASAEREVLEELTGEVLIPGTEPVLRVDEMADVHLRSVGVYRQPLVIGSDSSARQTEIASVRVFFVHTLEAPRGVVEKVLAHPALRELTTEEVRTTEGGKVRGVCADGARIANNIFPI